jgi:predicted enzyme related to lactoylglutathione lyase
MTEHSSPPAIGSILLASTNPARLRSWYEQALGVTADADGFLPLGGADLLIEARDDVAAVAAEPARFILNLHVSDARAAASRLDAAGATWVAGLDYRQAVGAWFGTVTDPDGNYLQIIELTEAYWSGRQERARTANGGSLADAAVSGRLPAQDLGRARRFYAEKLGIEPSEVRPGGLRYQCAAGSLRSSSPPAAHPASTPNWPGKSTTSPPPSPSCAAAASFSRNTTLAACAPSTASPKSRATTPQPAAAANGPPGSTTAKATCTAWASPSPAPSASASAPKN